MRCPYLVLETLINKTLFKGNKKGFLTAKHDGTRATKADLVNDRKRLFGRVVSGQQEDQALSNTFAEVGAVSHAGCVRR